MSKRQIIDWNGRHTPAWAAVNGAGVSALTASAGYLAHAPGWTGLAEGAAGAVAAAAVATHRRWSPGHRAYSAAAWLAAGGWTSWAMESGPWSTWWPATALVAGATLAWGCSTAYQAYEADAPERRRLAAEQAVREQKGDEWEDRLQRVCGVAGCHVVGVSTWETGMGYTIEVQLPPGGTTVEAIKTHTLALRADMKLPTGCSLEVDQGVDYGTAIIRVNTRDAITEMIPFPDDLSPTTVNEPFNLGKLRDGFGAKASLRFHCGLVIGQPEGGKTNLLNVINASLLRCTDVLLWHIDTTGAGITLPWLRAWAREGTASIPAIDWAATTVEEADVMLRVAVEIVEARKKGYQDLMYEVNDDKVPVSAQLPEIIIIVDEAAQLPQSTQDGLSAVINTGRASGVRAVSCALRGTRDMVSPAMKEMTRLRIAMRVSDESEYQHIFSEPRGLKKQDASVPGSGFFEYDNSAPRAFKGYRLEPKKISAIARVVADYRPKMDSVSLAIPSARYYHERWERTLPHLYKAGTPLSPAASAIMDRAAPAPLPTDAPPMGGPKAGAGGDGLDSLRAMLFPTSGTTPSAPPADVPQPPVQPEPEKVDSPIPGARHAFSQVLDDATWHISEQPPQEFAPPPTLAVVKDEPVTDPVQRRALELIDQKGAEGLGVTELSRLLGAEGSSRDRTTVHRWITGWAVNGLVVRQERGAGQVAYIRPWHDQKSHSA